ncbi:hypothetical protein Y032_0079g1278 [Ancylostoma ceylanicum]|uniref:Uncharacterized protein n=1 Tax=Ancylostoma ceylanicum TaxID=53326 RepID=A0A016TT51_9BILA|nr:hypothetical protein Y032_0079g1278 [Ancylostoma ceylanicum]
MRGRLSNALAQGRAQRAAPNLILTMSNARSDDAVLQNEFTLSRTVDDEKERQTLHSSNALQDRGLQKTHPETMKRQKYASMYKLLMGMTPLTPSKSQL